MCSGSGPAAGVAAALEQIATGLETLRGATVEGLPGPALVESVGDLHRLLEAQHAQFSRLLRALDRSGGCAAEGALSAIGWLRSECHLGRNQAAEEVRVARQLPELAETAEAFSAGQISFRHAAVMVRCREEVGPQVVSQAQPLLLQAARQLDPDRLRLVTRRLRYCLDPEAGQAEANQLHERRWLHLSQTLEGVFYLEGRLDAEGGSLLRTALEAISGPPAADDRRSAAQRRADALEELARTSLDAGRLPSLGGQRPHLTLTAELDGLSDGHLDDGQPLAAEAVRRIACDAALTPLVLSGEGQPLSLGRSRRAVSGPLRRALAARDGGCRFPGCDRPPAWTDAHHLVHWHLVHSVDGGETTLANTVLLCRPHHRRVHDEGWRLVPDGVSGFRAMPP
jgi:hypothetical protein